MNAGSFCVSLEHSEAWYKLSVGHAAVGGRVFGGVVTKTLYLDYSSLCFLYSDHPASRLLP